MDGYRVEWQVFMAMGGKKTKKNFRGLVIFWPKKASIYMTKKMEQDFLKRWNRAF